MTRGLGSHRSQGDALDMMVLIVMETLSRFFTIIFLELLTSSHRVTQEKELAIAAEGPLFSAVSIFLLLLIASTGKYSRI